MKKLFFIFLFFLLAGIAFSQEALTVKAFVNEDHDVLLRFAPSDRSTWEAGSKNGYVIERAPLENPVMTDTSVFRHAVKLISPLKPFAFTDTSWVTLIRKEKNAAFVYQALYGGGSSKYTRPADKLKAEQSSFGLVLLNADLSIGIARACGLYFKDSSNVPGVYAYRIRVIGKPGLAGMTVVDSRHPTPLRQVEQLSASPGDKLIRLSWNVSNNREDYAAYIIERSDDSINFLRVNKVLYVQLYSQYEKDEGFAHYTDSVPVNGKYYFYRVKGLSHFGNPGPASTIVKQKGKEKLQAFPLIDSNRIGSDNKVTLYWKMPAGLDRMKLKGFAVSRADKNNGDYHFLTLALLPPASTSFTDETPLFSNYYLIYAINNDDDSTHSYPVMVQLSDKDPPLAPSGLTGKIDTNGKVVLGWNRNAENDLKGYRVFRCNSLAEEFTEVTRQILTDNSFTDTVTLNTLTRNVYYAITAVDRVFNNSRFSAPLRLERPDKIAPVAPVFTNCIHTDSTVELHWIPSSSGDIKRYELSRRAIDEKDAVIIQEWGNKAPDNFVDRNILPGHIYFYTLTVRDSAGNTSHSDERSVLYETGRRNKITAIKYIVDREQRTISLSWNYPEKNIFSFVIYKCKKGEQLRIWKTVKGTVHSVQDKELYINNIYIYKIKAVLNSGAETELSDAVEITY